MSVAGSTDAVATEVTRVGGRVLASTNGQNSVVVPKTALGSLSDAAGISAVAPPIKGSTTAGRAGRVPGGGGIGRRGLAHREPER